MQPFRANCQSKEIIFSEFFSDACNLHYEKYDFSILIPYQWVVGDMENVCPPVCAVSLITTSTHPPSALKQKINICPTQQIKQITLSTSTDCN